jgi:hypothetical protein
MVALLVILLVALAEPISASVDSPVLLGDLHLQEYCQSLGYAGVTMTKGIYGPNYAYNNWRCMDANGVTHPCSMERACMWEYAIHPVLTYPTDRNNAFTWDCYSVQH